MSWGVLPEGYKVDTITDTVASVSIIFRTTGEKISFHLWPTTVGILLDTENAEVSEIMLGENHAPVDL